MELFVNFFFQAEDGIRDGHVTGVQTCALPISPLKIEFRGGANPWAGRRNELTPRQLARRKRKIGRASCRERVHSCGGAALNGRESRCGSYRETWDGGKGSRTGHRRLT